MIQSNRLLNILTVATVIGLLFSLFMALEYAGTDRIQGDVQRLFYIHVPSFLGAFLAFSGAVVGSGLYLATRQNKWDTLALACVEVGFVLALVNVALGSIWARPIWNTWWTDDPRMVSALVVVMTAVGYLMIREDAGPRFAAVVAIVLMGLVIYTIMIARFRSDTIHPIVLGSSPVNDDETMRISERMRTSLYVSFITWSGLLTMTLVWWRIRLNNFARYIQVMEQKNAATK